MILIVVFNILTIPGPRPSL